MKSHITFLKSDLLERYIVGSLSDEETLKVETYIYTYPEVANAYRKLQENLEIISKRDAKEVPTNQLNSILNTLNEMPSSELHPTKTSKKSWIVYSAAASVVAFLCLGIAYMFYTQNQLLKSENQTVVEEIYDLRNDIEKNNMLLDGVMREFLRINNPDTKKYIINGNTKAKNLKTIAYLNVKDKISVIDAISLPELPDEQYYEIWAKVQDKMISMGVLNEKDRKLINIPFAEDVLSLNITIEQKDGNVLANLKNTVANIKIKDKYKT